MAGRDSRGGALLVPVLSRAGVRLRTSQVAVFLSSRLRHLAYEWQGTVVDLERLATSARSGWMPSADKAKLDAAWDAAFEGTATTTDLTETTAASYTVPDATVAQVYARVAARRATGAEGAGYVLVGTFRRSGGTVTQIGATSVLATHEDNPLWNATLDVSGTAVRVRVTGVVGVTIAWQARGTVVSAP